MIAEDRELISIALREMDNNGALVGWVIIAEFAEEDGARSLRRLDSNASGEGLSEWTRAGYLHDALFSNGWDQEDNEA